MLGNLAGDLERVPLLSPAAHRVTKVFAGRDTRSGLHFHPDTEAFLCQVVGRKRVLLFPPEDWSRVYPIDFYSQYVSFSKVVFPRDGAWPDPQTLPRLAGSHPMECVVEPGDVLFIPIHWWHVVWSHGAAICATQFFRSTFRKRYLSPMGLRSNGLNRIGGLRLRLQMWRRGKVAGA